MQFPVFIELRRSVYLVPAVVLFHLLAAICVGIASDSWWISGGLWAAVGASLAFHLTRGSAYPFTALCLRSSKRLEGVMRGGGSGVLNLLPETAIIAGLIVLRFRIDDEPKIRTLCILPGQLSKEQSRVLRVWLRWHAPVSSPAARLF